MTELYLALKLVHIFAALALFAVEGVVAVAFPQARRAKDFAALAGAMGFIKTAVPVAKLPSRFYLSPASP